MRKIVILLASVGVFVAGCGGGSSTTSAGNGGTNNPVALAGSTTNKGTKDLTGGEIEIEQDDFYFNPTFIKGGTPGSTVTVKLKNEGKNAHTFTSTALGVDKTLQAGGSDTVTITLPQSGATAFFCRFHQQSNGMQGAFFFKDGDTVAGTGAAPASSSTSDARGYN